MCSPWADTQVGPYDRGAHRYGWCAFVACSRGVNQIAVGANPCVRPGPTRRSDPTSGAITATVGVRSWRVRGRRSKEKLWGCNGFWAQPEWVLVVCNGLWAQPNPIAEIRNGLWAQPKPIAEVCNGLWAQPEPIAEVRNGLWA